MEKVKLGEYVKIRTGKLDANASSENGQYPFFTCSVTPLKIDTYSYDCECVLVAGNGDLNVKYYNGKFDAYQRTYIIESKDKEILTVPYLYSFLDKYVETLREQSIGGVIKYIKLGNLTDAIIPLLSIEEQEKIVEKLDKVSGLIEKRKTQLEKLDLLIKSRFIEMFGGVHDSKIYPYKAVKELTDVVSGGTPSRDISEYWEEGTIPWVKTTELQNNIVTEVEEYITEQGLSNSSAKIVPSGTVLIAMYGQGKTRGMTAYLGIEACTNQACACILPSAKINQTFLWQFCILSYDNLRDMAKGGNQPNLNGNMIKNYPILCPPRELQEQFAAFVEQVDKSKLAIQKSIEKLETLKKALMQKYFG
jgi:type I restriction enzyme S subunit